MNLGLVQQFIKYGSNLVAQVEKNDYTDSNGHELQFNQAYQDLKATVRVVEAMTYSDEPTTQQLLRGTATLEPINGLPKRKRGFEPVPSEYLKNHSSQRDVILPKRGTATSAGYDFVTPVSLIIQPGAKTEVIWTDVCAYMQENEVLILDVRSSIGTKLNVMIANTIPVIDADYYHNASNGGNIGIMLRNLGENPIHIEAGERIAQGIFLPFLASDNGNTDEVRGGGFGSTNG